MEEKHENILRRHWSELRKYLEPMKLLPHMVDVLDKTDEQEVKVKATREEKVDELLDILPRKGPEAFQVFVMAVQKVQPFLASPLVQESKMEEMKVELNQARARSAKLSKKVQELKTDRDSERESHNNTVTELEKIISQYQNGMHSILLSHQELENANKKVGEALVAEKSEIELNLEKVTSLLEVTHLMKYSHTEETVHIQNCDSDRADSVLEMTQTQCELFRVSNERDTFKIKCGELEQQLEDTPASLERQRTVSFHDRATSPGEPMNHDSEDQGCLRCKALEEECNVLRTEKDFIKGSLKEKFEEEIKQLRIKLKELEEDYHREKQKLQDEIQSTKEQFERLSQNYTKELNSVACALAEKKQEMKTLKEEKDGLEQQLEKLKLEKRNLKADLVKEKARVGKNQKEIDKEKKNSKKKSKVEQTKKEPTNEASVKEDQETMKTLRSNLEVCRHKRVEETAKFDKELKSEREKCEALKKEIERWRSHSETCGRVFNHRKDFDRHGVIYALGTNFGTTAWVNPGSVSSPIRVIVTRSSDDRGEATDLLENKRTSLEMTSTKDEDRSWWCVDLSEKYALFLSHYTLRHGTNNGMSVIRNWRLEGSLDGRNWKLLKKHERDFGLKSYEPFSTATWSINGKVGAFRYFKIIQTGRNSSGGLAVFLSGIELYGILLEVGH